MGKSLLWQLIATLLTTLFIAACADTELEMPAEKPNKSKLKDKVIYGHDDRRELFQVQDQLIKQLADSTVALVEKKNITYSSNHAQLAGAVFGSEYNLCPSEPFRTQKLAAFCSGFLVADNIVVTAGHCIRSTTDCSDTNFVFNYSINTAGQNPNQVASSDVYSCKRIIKSTVDANGSDYAVIELDRTVVGHRPLTLRRSGAISKGDPLVVIGHPVGLPKKVAGGALVRSLSAAYFTANLDTYGGNSGSAVFNAVSGEVEGILVRGDVDFKYQGSCVVSNTCSDSGCDGEDVTKISEVLPHLPRSTTPTPPDTGSGSDDQQTKSYEKVENLAIPDNSTRGIESKILVDELPNGRHVYVAIDIEHSWRGDLDVQLVTPDGTQIPLSVRQGGSNDNLQGLFGVNLTAFGDLGTLRSVQHKGYWTLKVADKAYWDMGTLKSWGLRFVP